MTRRRQHASQNLDFHHRVWVGAFNTKEHVVEYFRHRVQGSDDDPISQFVADQDEVWQDLDLFVINYLKTPDDLATSLRGFECDRERTIRGARNPTSDPDRYLGEERWTETSV